MWPKILNLFASLRARELPWPPAEPEKAEKAVTDANRDLAATLRRNPEVRAVAAELRYERERNHFAERIKESLRGT